MPTELNFVKKQDRTFFNIHRPVNPSFDDGVYARNTRVPLAPVSEVDRQTGSGIGQSITPFYGPSFTLGPHKPKLLGMGSMKNNFDIRQKAPIDGVYEYSPQFVFSSPIVNRISHPMQTGGGSFAPLRNHGQQNPAINNWKWGTRIPEPMNTYEYSSGLQLHSRATDPVIIAPKRGPTIQGKLSDDNFKPFSQTAKYYNNGTFSHRSHNPLVYKN